jgi:hypothetical protein
MPIAIPVSVRREGDRAGGNRFAGARLVGPVGITDPARRIQAIKNLVGDARAEPALDVLGMLAPGLARMPAPLISQLTGALTKSNDLQARTSPAFAGTRISPAPRSSALTDSARCPAAHHGYPGLTR